MDPMNHNIRLPQVLKRLRAAAGTPRCFFRHEAEDGTWCPVVLRFDAGSGLYGELLSKDQWKERDASGMEEIYGEDYWLSMDDLEKEEREER